MENKSLVLVFGLALVLLMFNVSAYSDSVSVDDYDLDITYTSAIADNTFELTLNITNDANSAKNITIKFDEDDPFDFVGDKEWTVELQKDETQTKVFKIEVDEDADAETYELEFNLDDGSDDWNKEFDIKVLSDSVEFSIGSISSSPNKIIPDTEEIKLDVTIKNKGEYDAEDLIVKIELPEGFSPTSSYSDKVHVGDLDSGSTTVVTFYMDSSEVLEKKDYSAKIVLDYEHDGDDESQSLEIELPVFSIPQFEITNLEVLSGAVYSGSKSKIKISLKNIGGKDAEDVSIKVYERSDQPFEFDEKFVYIGNLDSGDTGYGVLEFEVENDASPIEYILGLQIRSLNGESVVVEDVSTKINVTEKEFNVRILLYIGIGLIFLLVLALIYYVIWRL